MKLMAISKKQQREAPWTISQSPTKNRVVEQLDAASNHSGCDVPVLTLVSGLGSPARGAINMGWGLSLTKGFLPIGNLPPNQAGGRSEWENCQRAVHQW